MLPRSGTRAAPVADTLRHAPLLAASTLLHAALLLTLWRTTPPPAPDTPPEMELAFEAAPAPITPAAPQPPEQIPAEPPAPDTPQPPAAEPPASEPVAPEPSVPVLAAPAPPLPVQSKPEPTSIQHITPAPKVVPKPRSHAAPRSHTSPPATTAPTPDRPTTPEAAPIPLVAAPPAPNPAWQTEIGSWLRAHKTYPDEARRDAEQGRVVVRFTVQRDGTVTAVTLLHGSGSAALDAAAQALLRGGHLPPFPASMPQPQQTISLGISYALAP